MSELTTEDLQAMKEFCGKSHLPILKELAVQAFDELLSLRTDAGDEEVVRLAEEYQLGETEFHRIQTYQKLEGVVINLSQQLRSAREEIAALTAERDEARKDRYQFRSDRETVISKIQALDAELAHLKSCPGMGEVDALSGDFTVEECDQPCLTTWMERNKKLADLARRYAAALTEERKRGDEVKHLLRRMLGAVITVRLENTPEWMEYMAEVVNEMNAAIGEADRVETHGDGIRILAICGKEVG